MRFTHEAVLALDKIDRGVILSVEELPGMTKWELWEGGLVKDKNTVTSRGRYILDRSKEMGIINEPPPNGCGKPEVP